MKITKGSTVETIETPDGAHVSKAGFEDTPFETLEAAQQGEVEFGAGFTQPTVSYGNVKFFVGIKIPFTLGEQDDVMDFAEQWVDGRLSSKMEEVKAQYGE